METEYKLYYSDDDPGNIVEALNNDLSYTMYEVSEDKAMIVMIHPEYINVKIVENAEQSKNRSQSIGFKEIE